MNSVIDITDLSVKEIDSLINTAMDMHQNPEKYSSLCKGKKLAAMFFEPSTRTRLSFEAAMLELGGSVLSVHSSATSSASKGESINDTSKVVSCYADIMAMRHPLEGAPAVAAVSASIPVINAGDGGHCHPTQTLTDLCTIKSEKGVINGLTVGFCGDLKYGRTVHSLISALARYENVRVVLISPDELKIPEYVKEGPLKNMEFSETDSLEKAMPELDVLYMTRVQQERFADREQYERLKDVYILDTEKLKSAKEDMIILHPLPRVNEISVGVDGDKRACYFKQVMWGKYMRMALIKLLLSGEHQGADLLEGVSVTQKTCPNGRCISHTEQELPVYSKNGRCVWCDEELN